MVGGSSRAAAVSPRCKYNWREIKKEQCSTEANPQSDRTSTGPSKRKRHVHHPHFLSSSCFHLGCQVDVYFQSRCLLPPAWIPLPVDSVAAGTLKHLAPPMINAQSSISLQLCGWNLQHCHVCLYFSFQTSYADTRGRKFINTHLRCTPIKGIHQNLVPLYQL